MRLAVILGVAITALKLTATAAAAGVIWVNLCGSYTPGSGAGGTNGVAHSQGDSAGIATPYTCPAGGNGSNEGLDVVGAASANSGERAMWEVDAPADFTIVHFFTDDGGMYADNLNNGGTWGGGFYWANGGAKATTGETSYSSPTFSSSYFGWQVVCGAATCNGVSDPSEIAVLGIELEATESTGPTVTPSPGSLGATTGWIRGTWPIAFSADGPSGACQLSATIDGAGVSQPVSEPQDTTTWHQCPAGSFNLSYNTASLASAADIPLTMQATDAAWDASANAPGTGTATTAVNIDNAPVSIALSGPTTALSTAGTQYVTAAATAGPSGVSGITCSVDGGGSEFFAGASAQVPVSGVGQHSVSCDAANNSVDTSGADATSTTQSWGVDIQQPTISSIGFTKVLDPLRCGKETKLVTVAGHSETFQQNGKTERRYIKAHRARARVTICHPRIERKRVATWKTVVRHRHKVRVKRFTTIKVAVSPHRVMRSTKRVRHGAMTTVRGWLGTPSGQALGGQPVTVLGAANNGLGHFRPVATTVTQANGDWTAKIPAGPSRLIEATYGGSSSLAANSSAQVTEFVPAKVELFSVTPKHVAWGATIRIKGRLRGGWLPKSGALLRLRIGLGKAYTTYGIETHVTGKGRFSTTYTFGAGVRGVKRSYWFQVATLPVGDYPYQPAASRKASVTVGR